MKRNFIYAALAAFGVMFLGSCAQELDEVTPNTDADGLVTITAAFPEDVESKVAFSESSEGLDLTWDKDDYLTIVGETTEKYTIDAFDGKVATFKGNPVKGTSFDVILSRSGDYASRTYTGQTQATVASKDHLLYDAVLKGVSSYQDVKFTSQWADEHDGTFYENGCMLIRFKMPEDAGYLKTVTLTAPEAVFYTTNAADGAKTSSMTLTLSDADMAADNVVEAYIMTSMQEASVSGELTLTVVSNLGTWLKKFTPDAFTLKTGMRNVITLNDKNWTVPTGDGSQANPYIIRTVSDLTGMDGKLASEKKYFAMVNDIDMASVTSWIKIENGTPIDFNGNNRTITNFKPTSYASGYRGFIGILNGRLANLTISNANVDGTANSGTSPCGIACGYCGTKAIRGDVENVHVQGTVKGNAAGVGGLAGVLGNGTINRCSADVVVTNQTQRAGGLVGYHNNANVASLCEISDCWTSGSLTALKHQKNGGIIGEMYGSSTASPTAVMTNCYSTMSLNVSRNAGGIVGALHQNGKSKVERCIAWNTKIESATSQTGWYSSGAVVGYMKNKDTMTDNYRRSDMVFDVKYTDKNNEVPPLFDCENFDSKNPFVWTGYNENSYWGSNYQPYHGKAAGAGETVSDVAKRLGWDETIWDLSGDYPQLNK